MKKEVALDMERLVPVEPPPRHKVQMEPSLAVANLDIQGVRTHL